MSRRTSSRYIRECLKLTDDLGYSYGLKYFGKETLASLPSYTHGPYKGRPRGYVNWTVLSTRRRNERKANLELLDAWISAERDGRPVRGTWMGEEMELHILGDRYLSEEGRQLYIEDEKRRQAAEERRKEEEKEEISDWFMGMRP